MGERYAGPDRRNSTTLTKEDLSEVVQVAMEKHLESDPHRFLIGWMAKEQRKQELWEKIKAQVIGWGCIATLTFFGALFWQDLKEIISSVPHVTKAK